DPPPVVSNLMAGVSGNGTVVSVQGRRRGAGALGAPRRQPVKCGVEGTACLSQVDPGDSTTMQAIPASGYQFAGWTGACTGNKPRCTVKAAGGSKTVGADFTPRNPRRSLVIRLRPPRIKAKFSQSVGLGTLSVVGGITLPAQLRVQLRRPGGGPLLTRRIRAAGSFGLHSVLRKGTLAGGAPFFPGGFVLSVTGRAGNTPVPLQMRTIFVTPPREGVVRKSYASTSENGKPVRVVPHGSRLLWAHFVFHSQPTAGAITVTWYDLNGHFVATVPKDNRPEIVSGIGGVAGAIPSWTYPPELKGGGQLVKRFRIKVA